MHSVTTCRYQICLVGDENIEWQYGRLDLTQRGADTQTGPSLTMLARVSVDRTRTDGPRVPSAWRCSTRRGSPPTRCSSAPTLLMLVRTWPCNLNLYGPDFQIISEEHLVDGFCGVSHHNLSLEGGLHAAREIAQ